MLELMGIGKATFTRKDLAGNRDFKVKDQIKCIEFYYTDRRASTLCQNAGYDHRHEIPPPRFKSQFHHLVDVLP